MSEISNFRGFAGHVAQSSLNFSTILTTICLSVVIAFIVFLLQFFASKLGFNMPQPFIHLMAIIFPSIWVGRFALAAVEGDLAAGYFNAFLKDGAIINFALRYSLLTAFWFIPLSIIYWLIAGNVPNNPLALIFVQSLVGASTFKSVFMTSLFFLLNICYLIFPLLCFLMASYTKSMEEVLSLEPWHWLLRDRKDDLKPFFVSVFGTMIMFFLCFFIPGSILFFICSKVLIAITKNPFQIYALLSMSVALTFFAFFLILIGRMSGAFVYGEGEFDLDFEQSELEKSSFVVDGAVNKFSRSEATKTTRANDFLLEDIESEIQNLPPYDLDKQIKEFSTAAIQSPQSLVLQVKLVFLYLKLEQQDKALEYSARAIHLCLINARPKDAIHFYKMFLSQRDKLLLTSQQWTTLGRACLKSNMYADAAWCIYHSMELDESFDDLVRQKEFLIVAHQAKDKNDLVQATAIYNFFLKKFPNSSLSEFVKGLLEDK